jgi:hypothetical protein
MSAAASIADIITEGGKGVGKSSHMPAFGRKLTGDQIQSLISGSPRKATISTTLICDFSRATSAASSVAISIGVGGVKFWPA